MKLISLVVSWCPGGNFTILRSTLENVAERRTIEPACVYSIPADLSNAALAISDNSKAAHSNGARRVKSRTPLS